MEKKIGYEKEMQNYWGIMSTVVKAIVSTPITRANGGTSHDNEHYVEATKLGFRIGEFFGKNKIAIGNKSVLEEIFAYGGTTGAKRTFKTKGSEETKEVYYYDTTENGKDVFYMASQGKTDLGVYYYEFVRLEDGKTTGFVVQDKDPKLMTKEEQKLVKAFREAVINFDMAKEADYYGNARY